MNPHYQKYFGLLLTLLLSGWLILPFTAFAQLTLEWEHTFGGTGFEELNALALTNDGGYIFGGITTTENPSPGTEITGATKDTVAWPSPTGDFWLVKTDGEGNLDWEKRFGGDGQDRLWDIRQTTDGGYILAGESRSSKWEDHSEQLRGVLDGWVVKTDSNGSIEWEKTFGGTDSDIVRVILPIPDGSGYLLAGHSSSGAGFEKSENSRGGQDYWLIRIDLLGNVIWDKTIGGDGDDILNDAEIAFGGGFILAGWSASNISFDKTKPLFGKNDYWIVKVDDGGNIVWQETYGGTDEDVCHDILPTVEGNYLLSGHSVSQNGFGNRDALFINITDNGWGPTTNWERRFGGQSADIGYAASQNSIGYYMAVGVSSSIPDTVSMVGNKSAALLGASDYWVLFLDPAGNKLWDESLGGSQPEKGEFILRAHDYGYIIGGISGSGISPPFKSEDSRGGNDMWVVRTGCRFPGPVLEDLPKVCRDEFVEVDASVPACEHCIYIWDDGEKGPVRQFSPDTTTQVKVTLVHPDGCELSDSVTIQIVPGPESVLGGGRPISCYEADDGEFFIEQVAGGTPPYQFSLNGGAWEDFADYARMPPGNYTLEVLDTNGCVYDTAFFIDQPEEVLLELGPDIFLDLGDSVQLQALTNLLDSFHVEWQQPDFLSCTDCMEPWVGGVAYTTTISARIVDQNGCDASDFLRVVVEKSDAVYIPNAFSPNNDNINDFFTVFADQTIKRVNSLLVFDRWGEKMFEKHGFQPNMEQIGWDGRFQGKFLDPAVFVYWAEVEYLDGRKELFEGDVAIIRK
ncbi:MAG: gliding motility-associated C-terminal domain-containing protein [Saprospiraceae bacterium]